jgi:hypothetical protein
VGFAKYRAEEDMPVPQQAYLRKCLSVREK